AAITPPSVGSRKVPPIARMFRGSIHCGAIRPDETQRAVVEDFHVEATLVHGTMMESAQGHEIRRPSLPAIRPMPDVVHVDVTRVGAAGEAAALVARLEQAA